MEIVLRAPGSTQSSQTYFKTLKNNFGETVAFFINRAARM
jgi:hypothetical protein